MANQDFRVKNGLQVGSGITASGIITASSFSGSGSGLTSIPAGQLSGTVPSTSLSGTYDISIGSGESVQTNTIGVGTLTATYSVAVGSGDNQIAITSTGSITGPSTFIIDPRPVGVGTTSGAVYIKGDLYVQGTQFQVDSTTINLADKVIGVGTTCTSNALLDGAGIGIGSDGNQKTFTFEDTGDNLKSSENLNLASGKSYKINNTSVLSGTTLGSNVANSSLTSVGTITTGTWQGNAINDTYIGTINNANKVSLSALNINGAAVESTVVDSDLMIIDDVATGTNKKVTASVLKGYFTGATYATKAGFATDASTAGIATNLKGGVAGNIPYQSGADTTSFLTLGTSSQVLIGGSSAPTFTNISGLSVDSATNADNVAVTRLDVAGVGVGTTSSYHLVMTDLGASGSYDNLYANPSNLKFKYRPDTNTLIFSNDGSSVGIITGAYYFGDESQNFIANTSPAGLTGSNNIIIGTNAGYALTEGSQNIIIGSGTTVNDNAGDKQLVIGAGKTDRWISGDSNFNIGIGHTYGDTISAKLDVKGDMKVSGDVTATSFVGDGSRLTNLKSTELVSYASASDTSNSTLSISGISTYNEVGILTGTYASNSSDHFGYSVATSADGNTIIVGAYYDNYPGSNNYSGVAYVFDREGNTFNEVGILTGSHANDEYDNFGYSVATSADGNTIIVGAVDDKLPSSGIGTYGLVYVFDRQGNTFNEVGILTGSHANDENDSFGISLACSDDGKTIIVGANSDELSTSSPSSGVVYVFDREGNTFNEVGILTGSHASDASDLFGGTVACSDDGKTIIVGAQGDELPTSSGSSGVAYVFDRQGNNFNEVGILTGTYASNSSDLFGNSVAISADGKTIIVGAQSDELPTSSNSSGVVYVFDREGNTFNEVGILTGTHANGVNDYFGYSVATSADGNTIVCGAYNDEIPTFSSGSGVAYVFHREGNTFNEVGILTGTHANDASDYFGNSVAISADGKSIIAGAYNDNYPGSNNYSGVVYVFDEKRETLLYSSSSGNIGIGSATPTAKLDVAGDLNVSGDVTATSFVGVADSATKVYVDESEDNIQYYNIIFSDENPDTGDKYHTLQVDNGVLSFNPGLNIFYVGGSIALKGEHTIVSITTSLTSVAGVSTTIDTFTTSSNDLAEYTISIGCNFFSSSGISTEGTIGITTDVITGIVTTGITPGLVVQNANVSYGTTVISIGSSEVNLSSTTTNVGIATTVFDFGNIQSHIQAQKVLVMHDGTTAYVQEYAIMSNPSRIVSIGATISGSNVLLQATPETGISGITTYKIVRGGLV